MWFRPLIALTICAFLSSCVVHLKDSGIRGPRIRGDGVQGQQARDLDLEGATGVQAAGAIDVLVEVGEAPRVELDGDQNVLPFSIAP